MRMLFAAAVALFVLPISLCGQDAAPTRLGPHDDPAYSFAAGLPEAVKQSGGKKKIVVYSVFTTVLRDQLGWLDREQELWSDPALAKTLHRVPLVAMQPSGKDAALALPQLGFVVLSPDGKNALATIDLQRGPIATIVAELRAALGDDAGQKAGDEGQPPLTANGKKPSELVRARDTLRREKESAYFEALPPLRSARDQLVIVKDRDGFLSALQQWDEDTIFPILFAESRYLPQFIAAYRPARILVQELARRPNQELDEQRLLGAWGAASGAGAVQDVDAALAAWKALKGRSPGLVLTHPSDPMALAGLALAAGRRQALAFVPPVAAPEKLVERTEVIALRQRVTEIAERTGAAWQEPFDELDFVTLACAQPYRYRDSQYSDRTPYAVDDLLTRDASELRWAHTGRLLGDEVRAVYQAMSSMFLQPERALLFSRYAKNSQPWQTYDTAKAAALLGEHFEVTEISHPQATLEAWHALFAEKDGPWGLVHVNSSGGARDWSTSKGKADFDDIFGTVPAIVSYTHSGSAAAPYDPDSIAGRWLERGAYVYFGSSHEPYLDAFVPIEIVYRRALGDGAPLAAAFRWPAGMRRWRPWKLAYFGDPLRQLASERPERQPPHEDATRRFGPELGNAARKNPFHLARELRTPWEQWFELLGQDGAADPGRFAQLLRRSLRKAPEGEAKELWSDLVAMIVRGLAPGDDPDALLPFVESAELESRALTLALQDRAKRQAMAAAAAKDLARLEHAWVIQLHARAKGAMRKQAATFLRAQLDRVVSKAEERERLAARLREHPLAKDQGDLLEALK